MSAAASPDHHAFGVPQSASHCWRFSRRHLGALAQKEYRNRLARRLTGLRVYVSPSVLLAITLAERTEPTEEVAEKVLEEWALRVLSAKGYR